MFTVAGIAERSSSLLGPNTALAYSSVVFMIERQIRYVLRRWREYGSAAEASIQVRREAQDSIQRGHSGAALQQRVDQRAAQNWYLDATGVNRALWPGSLGSTGAQPRGLDETQFDFAAQQHIPDGARVPS